MTDLTASEVAEILREIREDKRLTYARDHKSRPEHWIARYERHIAGLDRAILGYDNLAQRTAANG